jgi:hypothetical protein
MAYITGMDITEVSDTSTFKLGQLGQTEDGKIYKYVQYDTGSGSVAAVSGNVAYYYTLDGYKNNSVTSDLSDSIELGAGVLQSAPTDGQYCWIQVRGAATLTTALTAGTDGDPLTPTGSSDVTLDLATAITDNICAFAGDISDKEVACDFLL